MAAVRVEDKCTTKAVGTFADGFCLRNEIAAGRTAEAKQRRLVSPKNISRIDFLFDVFEDAVVAVGNDGVAFLFEFFQIVNHEASEETVSVLKRRFVNNNLSPLSLDAFHDALDAGLSEIVAI